MSNVIDSIIANKPIYPANKPAGNTAFTFNTEGKIKPMKYRGTLLPSKIFQTPVEYAKDIKGDIVSIGKAAKGKANDHELGRINDFAMKTGSLALAAYLCIKNPMKLSKAMEFVGVGTFFGAMALWPKLAIQAPVRARTGVDIHQKYIDSQGRKKMLFQDPQYVLTDLYSKEDLEKMGDKLGVSKDLPDRDNFIKQRAQKTALQGNTLWMMTAGPATPLISALLCNRLEAPVSGGIEKANLAMSKKGLGKITNGSKSSNFISKAIQHLDDKLFERFLNKNADVELTDEVVKKLTNKIGANKIASETLGDRVKSQLVASKAKATVAQPIDVKSVLQQLASNEASKLQQLPQEQQTRSIKNAAAAIQKMAENIDSLIPTAEEKVVYERYQAALQNGDVNKITEILTGRYLRGASEHAGAKRKITNTLSQSLTKARNEAPKQKVKLSSVADEARKLRSSVSGFVAQQGKLDKFVSARVGEEANTHIANQWDRVWNSLFKSLHLSQDELKALANDGDLSTLTKKLEALASNDAQYQKTLDKLSKLITDYDTIAGVETFSADVKKASSKITEHVTSAMKDGFGDDAGRLLDDIANETIKHAENRASGARNSFYRLIQALDVFKKATPTNGTSELANQLRTSLQKYSPDLTDDALDEAVTKLVEKSKKIVLDASVTDHIEKLSTQGYGLTKGEYQAVMETLFDKNVASTIPNGIKNGTKLIKGLQQYQDDVMLKVANWENDMTTDLARRMVKEPAEWLDKVSLNGQQRANSVASEITSAIKRTANNKYNSNKWLKIFGISFAALTAVTLTAGLLIGRKGEIEKQVEKESKVNG